MAESPSSWPCSQGQRCPPMGANDSQADGQSEHLPERKVLGNSETGRPLNSFLLTWPCCPAHVHICTHKCTLTHPYLIHAHMTPIHKFVHVCLHNTGAHSTTPHVHVYLHFSRMCACVHSHMHKPCYTPYNPFTNDSFSAVEIPTLHCADFDTLKQKVPE